MCWLQFVYSALPNHKRTLRACWKIDKSTQGTYKVLKGSYKALRKCFSCFALQHVILHDNVCFNFSEQRPSTALESLHVAVPTELIAAITSAPSSKVAALLLGPNCRIHHCSDCFAFHRTFLLDQVSCFGFAKHSNSLHKTNDHDNSQCPCGHTS